MFNKVCIPKKTEDLNLRVFNVITGINKSKKLTKHVSCKCEYKFDSRKCNSNQKWNNDKCGCECKNPKKHCVWAKDYICYMSMKNGEYVESIIDVSLILCDEIIDTTKTASTKTALTKSTSTSFYNSVAVLLITITLLIAFIICPIRNQSKQKHILSYK